MRARYGVLAGLALFILLSGQGCGGVPRPAVAVAHPAGRPTADSSAITYAVGTGTLLVTDPAGLTPARGATPAHHGRSLPTTLWFPTAGAPAATDRAGAVPLPARFPLVVFAHGFDVTPQYYEVLLHGVAARGYVVAAPLFPISGAGLPGAPREDDMFRQPGDITAVITELTRRTLQPAGPWSGTLDPSRVAVAGHSDGAQSVTGMVLYSGLQDRRVSAAVILTGRAFPAPVPAGPTIPTLVEQGLADTVSPPGRGRGLYDQLHGPKAYLTEPDGTHTSAVLGSAPADVDARACIVAFLDTVLRQSASAGADLTRRAASTGRTGLAISGSLLPRAGMSGG